MSCAACNIRAKAAASILEVLLKPGQYKTVGGLKFEENVGTTWVTYTIDWQNDRVTWAMNGVPLWTKWKGSQAQIKSEGSKATTGARNEVGKPAAKANVGVSAGNLLRYFGALYLDGLVLELESGHVLCE